MQIYKLTSPHSKKCYVGKTIGSLSTRFSKHRTNYNRWLEMKGNWCSSFGLLLLGDCSIELIEETEDQREGYWIQHLDCVNQLRMDPVANRQRRSARCREWNAANQEQKRASNRAYHAVNREQKNARSRERIICDLCGNETSRGNITKHKKSQICKLLSKD